MCVAQVRDAIPYMGSIRRPPRLDRRLVLGQPLPEEGQLPEGLADRLGAQPRRPGHRHQIGLARDDDLVVQRRAGPRRAAPWGVRCPLAGMAVSTMRMGLPQLLG
ncbi:hypothetical protein GCM10020000_67530 [Streptomyces olivoverticillatus]